MLRTCRAPVAVLLVGGIGLTVPTQMRDMLRFLDDGLQWGAFSLPFALLVLAGSAWFWSRALLAARFGVDDCQRSGSETKFDWVAFKWLPRIVMLGGFTIGLVLAIQVCNFWTIVGAVGLSVIGLVLTAYRPRKVVEGPPPPPRCGLKAWLHGGWSARLQALLKRAPYWRWRVSVLLLALGLIPIALGAFEAFATSLRLPNLLA